MAAGKINLQANDGKVLGLYAPDGMSANTDIVPANVNGDATKVFKVADAINADEALAKGQLLTEMKLVDGSGSGLDADLLRGLPADFTANKAVNGYQKLPSGLIIQWGISQNIGIGMTQTITFPIAFPNACLNAQASDQGSGESNSVGVLYISSSSIQLFVPASESNARRYYWMAIGY